MEEKLSDVKVSGSGSIGGGNYDEVKISGSAKINGNVNCNSYMCSGSSTANGNITAKEIVKISGTTKVHGDLNSGDLIVSGSSRTFGNVTAKKIKISGSSDIEGNVHTDSIDISGSVSIGEDCEAEHFHARGGFEIAGLLNAGDIEIYMYGKCRVKDIGGENITVKLGSGHFIHEMMNLFFTRGRLVTSIIEGDNIYLEHTDAKIVRGNNITIGPNCNIENIEYKNQLNMDQSCKALCKKVDE
ncbi:cytoskeletal protein CcmA (bactofilin family) [Clostridium acetobutylicum]|uniref:Uncharacterized, ortholog of YgaT gene of B.subtillis n=1 Tax=Clostridium acetobutylicum (strain ATCC 824 / DSM 792 / JCM 1419 / IAM 19013 / LMG 5710 / NBRC 13948 / NRRL B-527 / VKM B-1787 / 2291 / W) TaxID=272562 RepID=Q97TR2_CLOAB|nr:MULTISPECIES: polymer-forming cytoskeletal protein [Clostridium]AAK76782.1 Uncharacterized, ortholog of YgaT gene of B.subtillis [Clostridium acetobutylicum ATCC 824]ADZ22818.1 Conserved hypothetical protein [Clostridium acetobutylicum EA 2018]AEI34778.1 hypothetical protein SMB_P035 [Clostridium acetobutylicum DSM 1731]AWV82327.1 cell shape determination protein CcmA [Clostridium acetobutylicum]MBC2396009.1 polymer-forming cytoskeletal protein [Clostridium acetobutylicum]